MWWRGWAYSVPSLLFRVFLPALEGCDQSVDQIVDCFLRHVRPLCDKL